MTKVSVVIPTYNSARYLPEALESALTQTYQDMEVIVVDDGSTDNTAECIESFLDRITFIRQPNSGPSVARNRAIFAAKGKYIAFLDADDLWAPDKLALQVAHMESCPNVLMTFTDFSRNEQPGVMKKSALSSYPHVCSGDIFNAILCAPFTATSSIFVRTEVLMRAGLFDPTLSGGEDTDLWLRIADLGPVDLVNELLTFKRTHCEAITRTPQFVRDEVRAIEIWMARWCHRDGAMGLLEPKFLRKLLNLGWTEKEAGNYKDAALAYWRHWRHTRFYRPPFGSLLRAIVYSMPPRLICALGQICGRRRIG